MNDLIVLDVDGVLRDTSKLIYDGFKKGFSAVGVNYDFTVDDVWHLRGLSNYTNAKNAIVALLSITKSSYALPDILKEVDAEKILDKIVKEKADEELLETAGRITEIFRTVFNSPGASDLVSLYSYVKDSLNKLKENRFKLAIFTNSNLATVKRDIGGILGNFSIVVSQEDIKKRKPSGEGIIKAMEKLNYPPDRTYYVGDSCSDIKAAKDAKCNAVALLSGMGLRIHLELEKPEFIFDDLASMTDFFTKKKQKPEKD